MEFLLNYEEDVPELDKNTLYVEDLNENQRLFLIQAPAEIHGSSSENDMKAVMSTLGRPTVYTSSMAMHNIPLDVSKLDRKEIVLNGRQDLICASKGGDTDKLHVESVSDLSNVSSKMVVMLPSRNDDQLHVSKAITGSVIVSERIFVPSIKYPDLDVDCESKKEFVKHKWKAFGSRSPNRTHVTESPARKRKHTKEQRQFTSKDTTFAQPLFTTPEGSPEKRHQKKKKKRNSESER